MNNNNNNNDFIEIKEDNSNEKRFMPQDFILE